MSYYGLVQKVLVQSKIVLDLQENKANESKIAFLFYWIIFKLNRFSNFSKNVLNSLSQFVRTVFRHISDTSKFFKMFWRIQLSKESRNLLLKLLYGTEGRLSNSDDMSYIFSYSCRHFDLHIHLLFEEKIITF